MQLNYKKPESRNSLKKLFKNENKFEKKLVRQVNETYTSTT